MAPDPRSDAELLAAAHRGDAAAFDALYLRHRDFVVRLAQRICGNDHDALDVLQETFLYLLRKGTLELRVRFTTLLFPVVRHLAWQRRRTRRGSELVDDPTAGSEAGGWGSERGGWQEDLVAALGGLTPEQRETVLLRFVDGLSVAETAAALGIPEGTVKSRLHLALAALRQDPRARRYFLP